LAGTGASLDNVLAESFLAIHTLEPIAPATPARARAWMATVRWLDASLQLTAPGLGHDRLSGTTQGPSRRA